MRRRLLQFGAGHWPAAVRGIAGPGRAAAACLVVAMTACGGSGGTPSTPTSPSPPAPPAPPAAPTWSLSGTVLAEGGDGSPVAGARVEVLDGTDAGRFALTAAEGRFQLEGLHEGSFSIRATAANFESATRAITLTSNQVADFSLRRAVAPSGRTLAGSIVDGLSDQGVPGVSLEIDGLGSFTSAADGTFRIDVPEVEEIRGVTLRSVAAVERRTWLHVPGPDARLPLIPSSFDMAAFDQMFRSSGLLQRWIDAPRLTVQTRVLRFTSTTASEFSALDQEMSSSEVELLAADLLWGLGRLTAATFTAFASQSLETAQPGEAVRVMRTGEIVVARYDGLQAATGFWGFSRWATDGTGRIVGGIIMLDRGFDSSGSQFRRSLRTHELGHALGYTHVTARPSVMNSSARLEPNAFDLSAVRLAFQRPPGNQSPDRDPDSFTSNLRIGTVIWSSGSH